MYQHCGKHDKLYKEGETTCPGCDSEKILGPDDTLAELRKSNNKKKSEEKE
jgi:hypothetical protein